MMTVRAEQLVELVGRRDILRRNVNRVEAFQSRAQQIAAALSRLKPLTDACQLLRDRGIDVPGTEGLVGAASAEVEALRTCFVEDPERFIDSRGVDFRRFAAVFENACQMLQTAIMVSWQSYIESQKPTVSSEVLAVLARIPAYSRHVTKIREGSAALTSIATRIPSDPSDYQSVASAIAKMDDAWNALDTSALSQPVLNFLRSSSGPDGAPVAMLTEEVRQWLSDHRLEGDFRIRVRGAV